MAKAKGSPKTGGRQPGVPNKVTQDFRATVTKLLSDNAANVAVWLAQVADGIPETEDSKGVAPDPAKALDMLAKLAEYAAPKLNRTEHVGEDGGGIKVIQRIELIALSGNSAG